MTPPDPADAGLDALLRSSAPSALPDDGFALRVLASLPPATPPIPWWRLQVTLIAMGAAAVLVIASTALPGLDAGIGRATAALGSALNEPGAILALAVIAIAWSLAAGDEAVG